MGLHPLNRYHHFRGTWHIGGLVEIVFGGTHKFRKLSLYNTQCRWKNGKKRKKYGAIFNAFKKIINTNDTQ